ncbi:MAG TPA: peptidoglycan-binding domain-containing protein [Xanthobacteraceae bacterium]|nr:peptidoglycan-binding domain-containing protein [Xanthobacteraceae bacterium]
MTKAASIAAATLALPLAFSLPAVAAGLMEQAQQEGFRQAREASHRKLSPDQIKQVQEALDQRGFQVGHPDGVLGHDTRQALSSFQRQLNLEQTGQPDDLTLQALGVDVNASTTGAATTGAAPTSLDQVRIQTPGNGGRVKGAL